MLVETEELLEVMDLWPIPAEGRRRIEQVLADYPMEGSAWLFRYYGRGPGKVAQLEQHFALKSGAKHALATNSCTSALIASMVACGIGPGDDVIVPAYTFIASATAPLIAGAVPIIAEIDESLTIDPDDVRRKITPRTKAIVPVHMLGLPCRMDAIMDIAREHNLKVIEDTAQATGGTYRGKWLGTIGTAGCYSFDHFKILSSGEGGMVVTNDDYIYTRAQSYHDAAACWRPDRYGKERHPGELFAGENYRMSELQGAVGLAQLQKLDNYLAGFRRAKKRLIATLESLGLGDIRLSPVHDSDGDAAQKIVFIPPTMESSNGLIAALRDRGILGGRHDHNVRDWHTYNNWEFILEQKTPTPVHHPYSAYPADLGYHQEMCPRTLDIMQRAVILSIDPDQTDDEIDLVAGMIAEACAAEAVVNNS